MSFLLKDLRETEVACGGSAVRSRKASPRGIATCRDSVGVELRIVVRVVVVEKTIRWNRLVADHRGRGFRSNPRGLYGREEDLERGALTWLRLQTDATAVVLHDLFDDGESHSRAF